MNLVEFLGCGAFLIVIRHVIDVTADRIAASSATIDTVRTLGDYGRSGS